MHIFGSMLIYLFSTHTCGGDKDQWSDDENGACEELDGQGAMELAMGAWADWVSSKVDPLKKRV
ncbi:protein YLS7-like, partial [Trifolium medium]|nr:protein YLS7-like [Trifolium medium]